MPDPQLQKIFDTTRVSLAQPTQYTSENGGFSTYDQCFINCFPVTQAGPDGSKDGWVSKRPGSSRIGINLSSILGNVDWVCVANVVMTSLNDVYVCAIYDSTNTKFVICQYRPTTGTTIKIGEIAATSFLDTCFLSELTIANVCTLGVVWNSSNGSTSAGYYSTSGATGFSAASLTEITDTDFPPKRGSPLPLVGGFVQMNSTTYAMTNTGEIVNSDLNSITSWNTAGTVQAIQYPDQGVGLARYKNHIVAFGEDSIEFFSDVGNTPPDTPLGRTDQAFIKSGAINAKGIVAVEDTIYWLGKSSTGQVGLYRLDGYTARKVSGPGEDTRISEVGSLPGYGTNLLSVISYFGQKHIMIGGATIRPAYPLDSAFTGDTYSFSTVSDFYATLAYSISENIFWGFSAPYIGDRAFPIGNTVFQLNTAFAGDTYFMWSKSSGAISYLVDPGYIQTVDVASYVWTDNATGSPSNGTTYPVVFQPNRIMWNTEKRKRISRLKIVMDKIDSTGTPETTAKMWFLIARDSWNTNDTLTAERSIDIPNTFGRYYISNLGSFRTLGFAIVSKNKMYMRIRAIEIDLSSGTS